MQTLVMCVKGFLLGLGIATVFSVLKLDVPAPPTLAGLSAIIGLTVGKVVFDFFF